MPFSSRRLSRLLLFQKWPVGVLISRHRRPAALSPFCCVCSGQTRVQNGTTPPTPTPLNASLIHLRDLCGIRFAMSWISCPFADRFRISCTSRATASDSFRTNPLSALAREPPVFPCVISTVSPEPTSGRWSRTHHPPESFANEVDRCPSSCAPGPRGPSPLPQIDSA